MYFFISSFLFSLFYLSFLPLHLLFCCSLVNSLSFFLPCTCLQYSISSLSRYIRVSSDVYHTSHDQTFLSQSLIDTCRYSLFPCIFEAYLEALSLSCICYAHLEALSVAYILDIYQKVLSLFRYLLCVSGFTLCFPISLIHTWSHTLSLYPLSISGGSLCILVSLMHA